MGRCKQKDKERDGKIRKRNSLSCSTLLSLSPPFFFLSFHSLTLSPLLTYTHSDPSIFLWLSLSVPLSFSSNSSLSSHHLSRHSFFFIPSLFRIHSLPFIFSSPARLSPIYIQISLKTLKVIRNFPLHSVHLTNNAAFINNLLLARSLLRTFALSLLTHAF